MWVWSERLFNGVFGRSHSYLTFVLNTRHTSTITPHIILAAHLRPRNTLPLPPHITIVHSYSKGHFLIIICFVAHDNLSHQPTQPVYYVQPPSPGKSPGVILVYSSHLLLMCFRSACLCTYSRSLGSSYDDDGYNDDQGQEAWRFG